MVKLCQKYVFTMTRKHAHVFLLTKILMILSSTLQDTVNRPPEVIYTEEEFLERIPLQIKRYIVGNNTYEAMSNYCPYVMKCSEGKDNTGSENLVNSTGCCLPCQCGHNCYAKGNCCSDIASVRVSEPYNGTFTPDGRTCVETFMLDFWRAIKPSDRLYLLRQTCLDRAQIQSVEGNIFDDKLNGQTHSEMASFINVDGNLTLLDDVMYRCAFPNELELLDIIPVSSLTSGQSYRNLYCAYCNNDVTNLTDWGISLVCYSHEDLPSTLFNEQASTQEIYDKILEQKRCSVFWDPPPGVSVEKCFSETYMVSNCPAYVPKSLRDLCIDDSHFIPFFGLNAIYRNFFCYICNTLAMGERLLELRDDGTCASEQYHNQGDVSFSVLLDLQYFSATGTNVFLPQYECDAGLTYIEELGVCLEMRCPFHELQIIDQCVPFIKSLVGINMQFRISLISDFEANSRTLMNELQTTAKDIVLSATKGKYTDICETIIDGSEFASEEVSYSAYVAAKLPERTTLSEMFENFQKAIEAFNNGSSFQNGHLKANFRESGIIPMNTSYSRFMVFENIGYCTNLVALTKRQMCRFVVFRNHAWVASNTVSVNGVEFDETEYFEFIQRNVTEYIGICVKTYVEKILSKQKIADSNLMKSDSYKIIYSPLLVVLFVLFSPLYTFMQGV